MPSIQQLFSTPQNPPSAFILEERDLSSNLELGLGTMGIALRQA